MTTIQLKKETLSAEKFESYMRGIAEEIVRYRRVERSPELKELNELAQVVETTEFQDNKRVLLTRKYKETEEGKTMSAFLSAKNSLITRKYLAIENTTNFKNIGLVKKGQEWRVQQHSVQEYFRLLPIVEDEEFQKRNAFWSNAKRWFTTEESKKDARYEELSRNPEIIYYKSRTPEQIAEWETYGVLFADKLDNNANWNPGYYYKNPALKAVHSQVNEQQANTGGKNIRFKDGFLFIDLRKEQAQTSVWDPKKGFVPAEKAYTGDTINMGHKFAIENGLFMVKIRISGKAHEAVYLSAGEKQPLIVLGQYEGGKQVYAGYINGKESQRVAIEGMKRDTWYVLSARVSEKEIIWYVQDQEVMRIPNHLGKHAYTIQASSYLPESASPATGNLEMDWVKVLGKKQK